VRSWLLAGLSGLLVFLSFPKFGHGAVAWVALVPLLVALPGRSDCAASGLGLLTGFVASVGLLYWTAVVAAVHGGLAWPAAIGAMLLLAAVEALFVGLFAWTLARLLRRHGRHALLLAPIIWVGLEMTRTHTFFSFPWCLLGYTQHSNLLVAQLASLGGVYALSFLVSLSSASLAFVLIAPETRERRRALVGLGLILAATLGWGAWRLRSTVFDDGSLRIGLVQASIPQDEKWQPGLAWRNIAWHADLTREAARRGARLIVWPESAVPYYYDWTPSIAETMQELARETGASLLFGNDDREAGERQDRIFVGAKLVDPNGSLRFRYHKMQLVPFGEYLPLAAVLERLGVEKLVQEVGAFTPGQEATVGEVSGRRFGVTVCYEVIFPWLVRRSANQGADLLINITNDGWYGRTSAPYQHFAMARLRAIENGRHLLRAANTGITAVVDPRGRVLARTELFERTVIVHDVGLSRERTVFSRIGESFGWGCLGIALLILLDTFRQRRS
jgi:apolipoprotein N-acyltransferase